MSAPLSPYDPQPAPAAPEIPSTPPGHAPLEIPPAPATEPAGIPATDPDRSPDPGPSIPSDPQPRACRRRTPGRAPPRTRGGPVLRQARTVAVVGASTDPWRPSYGITGYLVRAGYVVHPVNPLHAGEDLHGRRIVPNLASIGEPVDLVDVFRRSEAIDAVVDDAIAARAPLLWLQLGIRNDAAVARARRAGIAVVQNRCISVEHSRRVR